VHADHYSVVFTGGEYAHRSAITKESGRGRVYLTASQYEGPPVWNSMVPVVWDVKLNWKEECHLLFPGILITIGGESKTHHFV